MIETSDVTTAVDAYLAAWNETDADRRAELVARAWAEDGRLTDPPFAATGHAGISDMAAQLHQQFPGHRFERTTAVDTHHGCFRFGWSLVGPDGAVALAGMDAGVLADDGRMSVIVGFFGDLQPA